MQFEKGYLYHIYNQGNNHQKVYFNSENYHYFLKKIRFHILPYADIIAWCLMPNHFHLMVLVNRVDSSEGFAPSEALASSEALAKNQPSGTFNHSIGVMLRAYTNAINKQRNRSGSLFRKNTKAECVNCFKGLTPSFVVKDGVTQNNLLIPESQYPQVLFNYIHQNPVKAGLVKNETEWEFSSALDYAGDRSGTLINKKVAAEYVNIGE